MTRWWAYATLVIALVCGAFTRPDVQTRVSRESELFEASSASTSVLRKRNGKQKRVARRDASSSAHDAIAPSPIELAPPRRWVVDRIDCSDTHATITSVPATARGPPVLT